MSKVSVFPDPSDKYRIVTSSSMPLVPYAGLMAYQTDTDRTFTYDGTSWVLQATGNIEAVNKLLYLGNPGVLYISPSLAVVSRYVTPSDHLTIIRNIKVSVDNGSPGATFYVMVQNGASTYHNLFFNYEIPLGATMCFETYIPLPASYNILAGYIVTDTADFTSGPVHMEISGSEVIV